MTPRCACGEDRGGTAGRLWSRETRPQVISGYGVRSSDSGTTSGDKAQAQSIQHLGPTAQDFYAAFGLGESDTTITTTDIDGVNLLAIQALERRTREQAKQIEVLQAEITALRAEIDRRRQ